MTPKLAVIASAVVLALSTTPLGGCARDLTGAGPPAVATGGVTGGGTTPGADESPPLEGDAGTPTTDSGELGGGGSVGEDADPVLVVAGPTLANDYPEYWGNWYAGDRSKCAVFTSYQPQPVTVVQVAVEHPLRIGSTCSAPPESAADAETCAPGVRLGPAGEGGCLLRVEMPSGTDLSANYEMATVWTLELACTGTEGAPCSEPAVTDRAPSMTQPVTVRWILRDPMRYCGATDYADDDGRPGGTGTSPRNGCSETASSPDESGSTRETAEPGTPAPTDVPPDE